MLFLLRGISWPYFRRHWVITLLTVAGVALGVGVYLAIELSAASLKVSMRQTVNRIAGAAQLEITSGEGGIPEETLESIRAIPEIASAQPIVEAIVRARGLEDASLMVLGIDFLGDRSVRAWDYDEKEVLDDPLVFLAQPDSICLTEEFASRHGLRKSDRIALETARGYRDFVVRGLIRPEGPATAFGGNIALMDLYAAQFAFSRGRRFDRIDVVLSAGVDVEQGQQRLASALGEGYEVDTPARRSAQMEVLIENFGAMLSLTSWQAIFVAVFLIFNVFAVAATRRRREIGILRSLGVARGSVRRLFLAEGAILGLMGVVVGLGAGLLMAGVATRFVIRLTEMAYGLTHSAPVLTIEPRVLASAAVLGLASAVGAAFFPARAASQLQPVEALAKGRFQRLGHELSRARLVAGSVLAVAAAIVILTMASRGFTTAVVGLLLVNLAAVLLAPSVLGPLLRLVRWAFQRAFGAEGRLAADSLVQAPRRTSATALALMVSVALVLSLAGMIHSFRRSYKIWLDSVINADLYISASDRFFSKSHRIPPEFEDIVASVPGVRWVEPLRMIRLEFRDRGPILATLPLGKTYRRLDPLQIAGRREDLLERIPRGEGFAVSENFARLFGFRVGDPLTLGSPTGLLTLPVLAILSDYSSDQGTIWLDRSVYLARWKDATIDTLDVLLLAGADRDQVTRAIRAQLASRTDRLFIMTSREFKAAVSRLLDQFFSLSTIQLAIALLVAVLGVTNTMVISVAERRRELGILKALGTERRQVFALVVLEALGISACGGLLGYPLGSYLVRYSTDTLTSLNTGWALPYVFPWTVALGLAALLVVVTIVAALYPARLALSVSPAEALEFE
jgi:putative ABC transport system permease protein